MSVDWLAEAGMIGVTDLYSSLILQQASPSILMEKEQVQKQTSPVVQVLFWPLFAWRLLISHWSKWNTQSSLDSASVSTTK